MHEMSITQGIVDICLQHAADRVITAVVVEIGTLSGVVPEAVEFCFAACTVDTVAAGAHLEIRRVNGWARCLECATEHAIERLYDPCPACDSYAVQLLKGEELRVLEIEVDD